MDHLNPTSGVAWDISLDTDCKVEHPSGHIFVFPQMQMQTVNVNASVEETWPSSDSEAATMCKLKRKSSNKQTGQGFK